MPSSQGAGGCSPGRWCAEVYLEGMRCRGDLKDQPTGVLAGLRRPARLRGEGRTRVEKKLALDLTVASRISCFSPSLSASLDRRRCPKPLGAPAPTGRAQLAPWLRGCLHKDGVTSRPRVVPRSEIPHPGRLASGLMDSLDEARSPFSACFGACLWTDRAHRSVVFVCHTADPESRPKAVKQLCWRMWSALFPKGGRWEMNASRIRFEGHSFRSPSERR